MRIQISPQDIGVEIHSIGYRRKFYKYDTSNNCYGLIQRDMGLYADGPSIYLVKTSVFYSESDSNEYDIVGRIDSTLEISNGGVVDHGLMITDNRNAIDYRDSSFIRQTKYGDKYRFYDTHNIDIYSKSLVKNKTIPSKIMFHSSLVENWPVVEGFGDRSRYDEHVKNIISDMYMFNIDSVLIVADSLDRFNICKVTVNNVVPENYWGPVIYRFTLSVRDSVLEIVNTTKKSLTFFNVYIFLSETTCYVRVFNTVKFERTTFHLNRSVLDSMIMSGVDREDVIIDPKFNQPLLLSYIE